jgi:hypothetical protein
MSELDKWNKGMGVQRAAGYDEGYADAKKEPVDMILHCPNCGKQHIDRPDPLCGKPDNFRDDDGTPCRRAKRHEGECMSNPSEEYAPWTNPVHKSHTCRADEGGCGTIWRPADIPTNGVAQIQTRGKADTWFPIPVDPATVAIPQGYARRGPDEIIKTNDLYFNGRTYVEVPKVPEFAGKVGDRPEPIVYAAGVSHSDITEYVWIDREVIPEIGCLRAFCLDGTVLFADGRPAMKDTYSQMSDGWTPELLQQMNELNAGLKKIRLSEWNVIRQAWQVNEGHL